jgi:hypothetical protein
LTKIHVTSGVSIDQLSEKIMEFAFMNLDVAYTPLKEAKKSIPLNVVHDSTKTGFKLINSNSEDFKEPSGGFLEFFTKIFANFQKSFIPQTNGEIFVRAGLSKFTYSVCGVYDGYRFDYKDLEVTQQ